MSHLTFETQENFVNWFLRGNVEKELVDFELKILLDDFAESPDKDYFIEWYEKQLLYLVQSGAENSNNTRRLYNIYKMKAITQFLLDQKHNH
jgi:hypothetical protein